MWGGINAHCLTLRPRSSMYYFGFIHWRPFSHVTSTKYLFADKGDLIVRGEEKL